MRLQNGIANRTAGRLGQAVLVAAGLFVIASPAIAAPVMVNAYENTEIETSFVLDFPELGISSTSRVVATRQQLSIDPAAGTARFVDYYQLIEPLALPLGISTGVIEVRIIESEGTYDPATQTFETNDVYSISFTNDLTGFGFESPAIIPSVSKGRFVDSPDLGQQVEMDWKGEGELENSEDPSKPFAYTYTCKSRTVIDLQENFPPIPAASGSVCGAGTCGGAGLGTMAPLIVGLGAMRSRGRRRSR